MTAAHSGRSRAQRRAEAGAEGRRRRILELLADGNEWTVRQLAAALGCSLLTVDYPLRDLAARGRVVLGWRHEPGRKGGPTRAARLVPW